MGKCIRWTDAKALWDTNDNWYDVGILYRREYPMSHYIEWCEANLSDEFAFSSPYFTFRLETDAMAFKLRFCK